MTIQTSVFYDDDLTSIDIRLLEYIRAETTHGAKRFDYRKVATQINVRSWETVSLHVGKLIRCELLRVDPEIRGIELTDRAKDLIGND